MKKNFFKFLILSVFFFFAFLATKAEASSVKIVSPRDSVSLREQFYVDLVLDVEDGSSINGIEGGIVFPNDKISLVRVENGKSIVNMWIQQPATLGNTVFFSGIMTNGFAGVIDPFNKKNKMPGIICRFVFEALVSGDIEIKTAPTILTLNDGLGTVENVHLSKVNIFAHNINLPFTYKGENNLNPEIQAYIIRDQSLFDNKYALIFHATDKDSGIKNVLIKEGSRDWKEIKSPYLLEDQTRHSPISLRAVNFSGVSVVIAIDPVAEEPASFSIYVFVFFFIIFLLFIFNKLYEKYKK